MVFNAPKLRSQVLLQEMMSCENEMIVDDSTVQSGSDRAEEVSVSLSYRVVN